ncbi:c-type cytochrome [Mucilaginibacter myungsuensis]
MGSAAHAQGDAAKGKGIFTTSCASCHKLDKNGIGPALGPIVTSDTNDKWLTSWIHNSQALVAAGDPKAVAIYKQYNETPMPPFPQYSDADVADVLAYIRTGYAELQKPDNAQPPVVEEKGPSTMMVLGLALVVVLAFVIILVLNRVVGSLEKLVSKKDGTYTEQDELAAEVVKAERKAKVMALVMNKKFVFFVALVGFIVSFIWMWIALWRTNVHQGYQPVQPIKYSHELHAGVMKIDCQYCHSGAYKSKNASIPSLNVCMNCHNAVKTESPEIHKIYDALGYDPEKRTYDASKARPIQWVRIHNLPDLVYFNHSQHVKVGKIICQDCHGPVQTMKEVYQYSPLTMKWCIQCHRRTEVNTKGNAYYDKMFAVHEMIKKGEKVTAAAMGGLECGKCHY